MSSQAVAWAIVHTAGGMSAKVVLLSIANYANEFGECWAAQATLAKGAECSVRQLRRVLVDLEARGLIEREARGGAGKGRDTDMIRLRMRELPAILSAQQRPKEQPDKLAASPSDKVAASHGNRTSRPGGNRTNRGGLADIAMSDNPKNPSLKPMKHQVPLDWAPSPALIAFAAERGFSEHEAKFMGQQMVTHFEGGERRAGWDATYKTWVNRTNPRQVKALAAQWRPLDYAEALRIWSKSTAAGDPFWDRSKYGPAPNEPGYRGPSLEPVDLFKAQGAKP